MISSASIRSSFAERHQADGQALVIGEPGLGAAGGVCRRHSGLVVGRKSARDRRRGDFVLSSAIEQMVSPITT